MRKNKFQVYDTKVGFHVLMLIAASCAASLVAFSFPTYSFAQTNSHVVKVFVLAGQSNMQGHGVVDLDHADHYNGGKGTLKHLFQKKKTAKKYSHLKTGDQWATRDDVLVRYKTDLEIKRGSLGIGFSGYEGKHHFGPELQFGHVIGDFYDEPVLIIKTAWGGKSLMTDFRPPSSVAEFGGEVGPYYSKMLKEVAEAIESAPTEFPELKNAKLEISGFVWQQGWNDMIDETSRNQYFQNLVNLINDVRQEWNSPDLPVVVGELGNGGDEASDEMKQFRRQQARVAAHPPFVGNVAFAPTTQHARAKEESPNVGHGHHWFGNAESYLLVGESLGKAMIALETGPQDPRILMIGDSISIGYMPMVKSVLADTAFVVRPMNNHRAAENCAGTENGVKSIDRWISIGGGKWDVIHFNFGLHDLKHVNAETRKNSNLVNDPEQSPPEVYEKNLREIVIKLKATGAKLIFATTTPVPDGGVKPYRDPKSPEVYNRIARKIMEENGIEVNDLYGFANERLDKIQLPANVHFSKAGSNTLGDEVVRHIKKTLEN